MSHNRSHMEIRKPKHQSMNNQEIDIQHIEFDYPNSNLRDCCCVAALPICIANSVCATTINCFLWYPIAAITAFGLYAESTKPL